MMKGVPAHANQQLEAQQAAVAEAGRRMAEARQMAEGVLRVLNGGV